MSEYLWKPSAISASAKGALTEMVQFYQPTMVVKLTNNWRSETPLRQLDGGHWTHQHLVQRVIIVDVRFFRMLTFHWQMVTVQWCGEQHRKWYNVSAGLIFIKISNDILLSGCQKLCSIQSFDAKCFCVWYRELLQPLYSSMESVWFLFPSQVKFGFQLKPVRFQVIYFVSSWPH